MLPWECGGGGREAAKLSPFPCLPHTHAPGELACQVDLGVNRFVPCLKSSVQNVLPCGIKFSCSGKNQINRPKKYTPFQHCWIFNLSYCKLHKITIVTWYYGLHLNYIRNFTSQFGRKINGNSSTGIHNYISGNAVELLVVVQFSLQLHSQSLSLYSGGVAHPDLVCDRSLPLWTGCPKMHKINQEIEWYSTASFALLALYVASSLRGKRPYSFSACKLDQFSLLGNCPPTLPLSQH